MAMIKNRFYFGSAGDLQPLPAQVRGANTSPSPARYGNSSRALTGSPTIVPFGFRRSWPLSWPLMAHEDSKVRVLQRVEAAYRGYMQRRAYLLDTRQVNAFPPDVASCGGEDDIDNFTKSSGTLNRVNSPAIHADLWGHCDGYLEWNAPTSGAGQTMGATKHLPVAGDSTGMLFSAYLNTDTSGSVKLGFGFYDEYRGALSAVYGSTIVLSSTVTRYAYYIPAASIPAGAASFVCGMETAATTGNVSMSGWQLEYDPESTTVPQPWGIGAGGAEVVVDAFTTTYPDAKQRVITASFLEV